MTIPQPPSQAGAATLLLVEDDPNDVLLIQRAFLKANLPTRLELARDGEEAVAYLAACGDGVERDPQEPARPMPLAILLDLKLPRKSGLEVLQWVRHDPRVKWLPVVVLTSSREETDLRRAYELGANSYLIKPVRFDALLDMMRTVDRYWVILNEQPAVGN